MIHKHLWYSYLACFHVKLLEGKLLGMSLRDKGCWDFLPGLLTCGCSWLCCFVAFSKSQCFSEVNNHDVLWCQFSCQAAWPFPWHYPRITLHNPAMTPNHPSQFKLRSFIFSWMALLNLYNFFSLQPENLDISRFDSKFHHCFTWYSKWDYSTKLNFE